MNDSKISVRYAKALFALAQEQNIVDDIKDDIVLIKNTWDGIKEIREFLESPIVRPTQKKLVIQKVFQNKINKLTQDFLNLVLNNKRELYIASISRVFMDFYKKHKGVTSATITTTYSIDNKIKATIIELIKGSYTQNIELNENVKPEIIGGFVLRIDDQQIDASVSKQLKKMKKDLLNTTIKS